MNQTRGLMNHDDTDSGIAGAMMKYTRLLANRRMIVAALLLETSALVPLAAWASPADGHVTAGAGTIAQSGATTTINQQSQNLAINWQSFNVGANEAVNFVQPNASSIALNRVLGQNPSEILGQITANGQVFILNPNGVLFGKTAQVDVGGLVASTMNMSDADLMSGKYTLTNDGSSNGSVVNEGTLTAASGGYVALVGANVRNEGVVSATLGTALLAAGDQVTLNINNGSLLSYSVDKGAMQALAENKQLIQADGGHVYMTARAADALGTAMVNNSGVIEARTVQNRHGEIILTGDDVAGEVSDSGKLDASAATGKGGKVVVTANHVLLGDGARIDASGKTGGGEAYIGGGWQGRDAAIRNASAVVVAPGASIDVSATGTGNGGTAVLWSQDYTAFAGMIAARGGINGGNGGRVETSSHGNLQALGLADVYAPAGTSGNWLLDPRNVTIDSSGAAGTSYSNSFVPTADSTILSSSIAAALNSGSNVTITTGSTGGSTGDITVNAAIAMASSANATLTLTAANDIDINAAISNTYSGYQNSQGRLNVVLTADADNASGGDINFGAGGQVTTNNGNFTAGKFSGNSIISSGQDMTMASGSFIDVGMGNLDISVAGDVTLAGGSLKAVNSPGYPQSYYQDGSGRYNQDNYINVTSSGGSITSNNTNAAIADIVTSADTFLNAGTIGGIANPVKIAGPADLLGLVSDPVSSTLSFPGVAKTLYLTNTSGSSYVSEITQQVFSNISLTIGSQLSKTQNVQIMGDAGGNGTTGNGHIILNTDGSGLLNIASGNVKTGGTPGTNTGNNLTSTNPPVFATSVEVNAPAITFANHSVDTGTSEPYFLYSGSNYTSYYPYYYSAGFTANATTMTSTDPDTTPDISTVSLSLTGRDVGTLANTLNIGGGSSLSVYNTGGSTFINSVDDSFSSISLVNVKDAGTDTIHFSGGDHIDYLSDGSKVYVPGISPSGCANATSCGIDVSGGNRSITLDARSGNLIFADNAVNTGNGYFTAQLDSNNTTGLIAAENTYNASAQAAQITAGNVEFDVYGSTAGTIGGGGKDIQIAQSGNGTSDNTLTVNTQQGNVSIHELTANYFKTLNVTLNGSSAAQNVAIDLNGADDVNFSDSGSLVTIDATKVNLSADNRNWNLYTPSRSMQVNGVSLGSGYYTLSAGSHLKLNSDIVTNDGAISLTGSGGIDLMQTVNVDSNSDNLGASANISTNGTISSTGGSHALTLDANSSNSSGGTIQVQSNTGNSAGAYLSGLTLTSTGANVTGTQDGGIYLYDSSYLINGNFLSAGNTSFQNALTIDTEQGNTASGGNITFQGRSLSTYTYGAPSFNTSTTATGFNGGNVDLYGTYLHSALSSIGMTVLTTGGTGGTSGSITLPAVTTTMNGYGNTQSYTGGIITLNGNLTTDKGAVTLSGDTRLASDITIDTWAATNSNQTGTAGAVTIGGTGVSANATGLDLTIDTSTNTGSAYFDAPTNTVSFNHSGGAVAVKAGNASGHYLDTLTVNTAKGGTHNSGTNGTIALNTVGTEGTQSYSGGAVTLNGDVTTNGGNIALTSVPSITLAGDSSLKTDRSGGTGNAGTLDLGTNTINGAHALAIDVTADGGGTSQDFTLNAIGDSTALGSLGVAAQNLTVGAGITTTGNMTLEARGATSDLTLNAPVTTSTGTIIMAAGRDFLNNNTADTGIITGSGRYLVYSANPADSNEGMTTYSKHYSQSYTLGSTPSYAGAGNWFLYSSTPILLVTPDPLTLASGSAITGVTYSYSGYIDGDTAGGVSGTPVFTASMNPPGVHDLVYSSGLVSSMGYGFADNGSSVGELTVLQAPNSTQGAQVVADLPGGDQLVPAYTGVIASAVTPPPDPGATGTSATGSTPTQGAAGAPQIIKAVTLQDLGTVSVQNGGVNMPSDATTAPAANEDDKSKPN